MPRQPPCRRHRSPMPAPQGKRRAQKKQGNFRVFCNDTTRPSRCGRVATTRRQQSREHTPGCPLAEKKFRDRVRFRHRTSANAQKCANFFASCAGRDARDASRQASSRRGASRHCDATCTHLVATPQRRRPPRPPPRHAATDSFARVHRPTRIAQVAGWRRHAPLRRAATTCATHAASPLLFLAPHTAPHPVPRRKTGAAGHARRMHRTPPRGNHAALEVQSGDNLTPSSHQHTARRLRHGLPQRPCRGGRRRCGTTWSLRAAQKETGRTGRPVRVSRRGGRLSGRLPRAVRRTRPARAVRSTARRRPLPAPGSSLRRRRLH